MSLAVFECCLSSSKKALNRDSNPGLCNACAVLYQLSYQANWELIVIRVHDEHKPGYTPKAETVTS